jgi:hypothetical protein
VTHKNGYQGVHYKILVKGHLESSWGSWFEGMNIQNLPNGETKLSGRVTDQAMLHGLLIKIRDLGLPLISINRFPAKDYQKKSDE